MDDIGWDYGFRVINGFDTKQDARKDLEENKDPEYRWHDKSLFIAKQITEEIDPLPQRKPKRKAAERWHEKAESIGGSING